MAPNDKPYRTPLGFYKVAEAEVVSALRRTDTADEEPVVTEVAAIAGELPIATIVVQVVTTHGTDGSSRPPAPDSVTVERPTDVAAACDCAKSS